MWKKEQKYTFKNIGIFGNLEHYVVSRGDTQDLQVVLSHLKGDRDWVDG